MTLRHAISRDDFSHLGNVGGFILFFIKASTLNRERRKRGVEWDTKRASKQACRPMQGGNRKVALYLHLVLWTAGDGPKAYYTACFFCKAR